MNILKKINKNPVNIGISIILVLIVFMIYQNHKINKHNKILIEQDVDFWLKNLNIPENSEIVMNIDKINKFNDDIVKNDKYMFNFNNINETIINKTAIKDKILRTKYIHNLPDINYLNIDILNDENYELNISYAIVINRTNLRLIPTNFKVFNDDDENFNFDNLQQKELKFNEAIIILHYSIDKKWAYVQSNNADGWVETENLATFNNKNDFLNYINMTNFLIVVDKNIIIENKFLDMGTKIQLINENDNNYNILFPERDKNGNVIFVNKSIEKNEKLNKGYLKYTRYNVIQQALKYYGEEYGWGGLKNSVDCSGLVNNVYTTFGFNMPRNSKQQQMLAGDFIYFKGIFTRKNKILNKTPSGALLYMKGHIMIYLGKINKKYYFINAISGYSENNKIINVMKVNIMNLDTKRKTGKSFKQNLISVTNMSD